MNILVIGDGGCLFHKPAMIRIESPQLIAQSRVESMARFWVYNRSMTKGRGGFKNVKLGKNVYRQLKRRGPPLPVPARDSRSERNIKPKRGSTARAPVLP